MSTNDLALRTNALYGCTNFHLSRLSYLLQTVDNPPAFEIVGRQFNQDPVAGQNPDEVLAHLSRNVREHQMLVFQLDPEHGIWQGLGDHRLNFYCVFLRQDSSPFRRRCLVAQPKLVAKHSF